MDVCIDSLQDSKFKLAWDIFVSLKESRENTVYSPICAVGAFAALVPGSCGRTRKELSRTLHIATAAETDLRKANRLLGCVSSQQQQRQYEEAADDEDTFANAECSRLGRMLLSVAASSVKVCCMTRILVPETSMHLLNAQQRALLRREFGIEFLAVDMGWSREACKHANKFLDMETRGQLGGDIVRHDMFSERTKLILASAFLMEGEWLHKFDSSQTTEAPFFTTSKQSTMVRMMHLETLLPFVHHEDLKCALVALPFEVTRFSLILLLPDTMCTLNDVEVQLRVHDLVKMKTQMQSDYVHLSLPRFRLHSVVNLAASLKALGAAKVFDDKLADLSGLCPSEPLHVSHAVQRIGLAVNETGITAASQSRASIGTVSPPQRNIRNCGDMSNAHQENIMQLNVNHPFMFFLWDEAENCLLLMGQVRRP